VSTLTFKGYVMRKLWTARVSRDQLLWLLEACKASLGYALVVSFVSSSFVSHIAAQAPLSNGLRTTSRPVPGGVAQQERVVGFINDLSDALPRVVHQLDSRSAPYMYYAITHDQQQTALLQFAGRSREATAELGGWNRDLMPSVVWMDSLGTAWRAAGDEARAAWCFSYQGGQLNGTLVPSLIQLTSTPAYLPAIERFATLALTSARQSPNVGVADELTAAGQVLTGFIALERADTTSAIQAFVATARLLRTDVAPIAVRALSRLVQRDIRPDDTTRIMAMTLRHLIVRGNLEQRIHDNDQLRYAYTAYLAATKRTPPDIISRLSHNDQPTQSVLSLDAYLDRQWSLLFDREFPVIPVAPSVSKRPSRLVVVEYQTGQGCEGCWAEDMGLQPLTRRYPADQVVVLAWHGHPPLVGTAGRFDWWGRYGEWYPSRYVSDTKSRPGSRSGTTIPFATLLTPTGDTLVGRSLVDGYAIASEERPWTLSGPESYYRPTVALIDRERPRAPDITLKLAANTRNDSIHVNVRADSLHGIHHALALRIVLFADTVWKRGGNARRIYTNVVQDAAHNDTLSLGVPLPGSLPGTISYSFDLAAIQGARTVERDDEFVTNATSLASGYWGTNFPDPRDWQLDRTRLHVVAFVQDLETGEVLNAVRMKVPIESATKP
jgi:hypothetical protein